MIRGSTSVKEVLIETFQWRLLKAIQKTEILCFYDVNLCGSFILKYQLDLI